MLMRLWACLVWGASDSDRSLGARLRLLRRVIVVAMVGRGSSGVKGNDKDE